MKVIKTNDTIHLYRDDVETYERIPVGCFTAIARSRCTIFCGE